MKQKIVIKVEMSCEKCKKKVMQIAASTSGVKSMELVGEISDGKIMVTGEEVDAVSLTQSLRKKTGRPATIESVEQVKPPEPNKEEPAVPKVEFHEYPYTFYPPYFPYTFYSS